MVFRLMASRQAIAAPTRLRGIIGKCYIAREGNMRWWRHLGSSIALVVGCLSVAGGASQLSSGAIIAGTAMILGALAYRSAKRRRLGEVAPTLTRRASELIMVGAIVPLVLLQANLKYLIATDPV